MHRVLMIVALAFMSGLAWLPTARGCVEVCEATHVRTLAGAYVSPFQYRPFAPLAVEALGGDLMVGYFALHVVSTAALLAAMWRLGGLSAAALTAAVLPLMFAASWGWIGVISIIEAATWGAALILLERRRRWEFPAFVALIAVAALNRETAIFIALIYGVVRRDWMRTAVLMAVWAAVYGAIRIHYGAAPDMVTVAGAWAANTGGGWWTQWAVINNVLLIPIWLLAIRSHRASWSWARESTRRAAVIVPIYLIAVVVFGLWNEVRLLLPLFPLAAGGLRDDD
jgi:hypothetical protein